MKIELTIERLIPLTLGRSMDSGVDQVCIDIATWLENYPQLTAYRIEVTTPDGVIYMPAHVQLKDTMLVWDITDAETYAAGRGFYQVVAVGENDERKTSAPNTITVQPIMPGTASETPPEPAKPWVDQVFDAAERAEAAADRAEAGGVSPEQIEGAVQNYLEKNPPQGVSDDYIKEVTAEMLEEAKASGEFDGAPGAPGKDGEPGKDYILTEDDKREIASMVEVSGGEGGNVTDAHIIALIDERLGVIENGTY